MAACPVHRWAWVAGIVAVLVPVRARAYEFDVRARSIAQALELQVFGPLTGDRSVSRRRFTQWLTLEVWGIGDDRVRRWSPYEAGPRGPRLSFHGSLRVDHDFGGFTSGTFMGLSAVRDATDFVPELEDQAVALDVLTMYFAAEDLFGGRLDLYAGRQLEVDQLEWWSFDGVTARARVIPHLAVEAFGGLRVRDSSYLGSSTFELDGTGSAECREYVEGDMPGSGAWRPIDLGVPSNNAFRSDYDLCPQRRQLQPTVGGSIGTDDLDWLRARLSYRRTMSPSPGLLQEGDRDFEADRGFYPNDSGQAPDWGVNEDEITASVRGHWRHGRSQVDPYAAVRYSFLHGLVDEAQAGARLAFGAHAVEPEFFYSFPTFDGDSIFNVFSIQPYWDLRATYSVRTLQRALSLYVRPWLRHFRPEEATLLVDGSRLASNDWAGGAQAGARYRLGVRDLVGLDGYVEGGYGGRRIGAIGTGQAFVTRNLGFATRLTAIDFDDEQRPELRGLDLSAQLSCSYRLFEGVALRGLGEYTHDPVRDSQLRLLAVLDLAFQPEL